MRQRAAQYYEDTVYDQQPTDKEVKKLFKELREKLADVQCTEFSMSDFNPRVLAFKEELSDSCLIHYACDYGNLDFLQKMNTFHSEEFIEKQISLLTKTGRSALHLAM